MARQTTITLIDDLDGAPTEADESIEFGIDRDRFEIDLSEANARKLREILSPFVAAARRAGSGSGSSVPRTRRRSSGTRGKTGPAPAAKPTTVADREQNQAIRDWAVKKGLDVAKRGRISEKIREAFDAEH